jgi:hypothetical protein
VFTIRSRVLRLCQRVGLLGEECELEARSDAFEQGLLPLLSAVNTVPHTLLMISNKGVPRTARFGGS